MDGGSARGTDGGEGGDAGGASLWGFGGERGAGMIIAIVATVIVGADVTDTPERSEAAAAFERLDLRDAVILLAAASPVV